VVLIHGYPLDGHSWEKQVPVRQQVARPDSKRLKPHQAIAPGGQMTSQCELLSGIIDRTFP
jgi:pimeloyl-ACP methyl ester carboxylesterase